MGTASGSAALLSSAISFTIILYRSCCFGGLHAMPVSLCNMWWKVRHAQAWV